MDDNKENHESEFNGTVFHEGFKFHRKYIGKKVATYWCCNNREKSSACKAKIKVYKKGKVTISQGDHHISCHYKQAETRKALGFIQPPDPEDDDFESPPDLTAMMLKRAEEIALNDISMPSKKVHFQVLREAQLKHKVFKAASDHKIINKVRNARTNLNGNDVFRTTEMDTMAKVKILIYFFYILILLSQMSTMGNWNELLVSGILLYFEPSEDAKECSSTVRLNSYQNHFINV